MAYESRMTNQSVRFWEQSSRLEATIVPLAWQCGHAENNNSLVSPRPTRKPHTRTRQTRQLDSLFAGCPHNLGARDGMRRQPHRNARLRSRYEFQHRAPTARAPALGVTRRKRPLPRATNATLEPRAVPALQRAKLLDSGMSQKNERFCIILRRAPVAL